MSKQLKWLIEYIAELKTMSNADLFEEFMKVQYPDDYDGVFTGRGWLEKTAADEELKRRLAEIGFLKEEE